MIENELLELIKSIWERHKNNLSNRLTRKELIFSAVIKIQEELWELSSEILIDSKIARSWKIDNFKKENLELEFADVIMSTLMLANFMDIDINKSLKDKITKINNRWWY